MKPDISAEHHKDANLKYPRTTVPEKCPKPHAFRSCCSSKEDCENHEHRARLYKVSKGKCRCEQSRPKSKSCGVQPANPLSQWRTFTKSTPFRPFGSTDLAQPFGRNSKTRSADVRSTSFFGSQGPVHLKWRNQPSFRHSGTTSWRLDWRQLLYRQLCCAHHPHSYGIGSRARCS